MKDVTCNATFLRWKRDDFEGFNKFSSTLISSVIAITRSIFWIPN